MFKKNLFKSKILANGKSIKDVASAIGCNEVTLYRKMNGESDFTRNEIQLIKRFLGLNSAEIEQIFLLSNLRLRKSRGDE